MSIAASLRPLVASALALLLVAIGATAAHGHASGELPHARLSAEGDTVTIVWTAAADDVADAVVAAGVWPEEVAFHYLDVTFGGDPELLPSREEVAAASRDPALSDYLTDNVEVVQDGRTCDTAVTLTDDVIADGATFTIRCPEPVEQATVSIRLLHDRDPYYRTFSVDGTEQYAVHTSTTPAHEWDFTRAAGGGLANARAPLLAAGAVLSAAALLLRRLWRAPAAPSGRGPERTRT